jgi:hypothetical protein
MDAFISFLENPLLALAVCLLLGAVAMSGKFSQIAANLCLVGVCTVGAIGILRAAAHQPRVSLGGVLMLVGFCLIISHWIRPPATNIALPPPQVPKPPAIAFDKTPKQLPQRPLNIVTGNQNVTGNTVTQGPGSIAQLGGSGNTATVYNTPPQRVLTYEQKAAFIQALGAKRITAGVYCYSTDKEGCTYARYFFDAFNDAGWDVGVTVGMFFATPLDSEVYLTIQNRDARPEGFQQIWDGLKAIGLATPKLNLLIEASMKPEEIRLTIGRN